MRKSENRQRILTDKILNFCLFFYSFFFINLKVCAFLCYYAQYFGGFGGLRIRRIKRQNEKIILNYRFSQNVLITPQKRSDPGGPARDENRIMKNPGFEDRDKQGG